MVALEAITVPLPDIVMTRDGESTENVAEVTTVIPVNVVVLLKLMDRVVTANGILMT